MNHLKKSDFSRKLSTAKFFSFYIFFASLFLFSKFSSAQVQTQKAVYSKIGAYVNAYYESLPVDYASNSTKKYPLLIFIHGVGEVGNGSTSQLPYVLKNGPPKMLNVGTFPSSFSVGGKSFSFIVISPQLNDNNYTAAPTAINDIINYCKQKYRVDDTRIYLTGLSMGGTMTWQFGGKSKANADKLAAVLTVCGSVSNNTTYVNNTAASKLPIWSTVNSGDPVMSPSATTAAINAINAYVPTPPKALVDVFPVSGHDAWTKTYDPNFTKNGLNVYQWMLSYTRGGTSSPAPAPAAPVANAGSNQVITLPTNSVTVDGTNSTASGGTITNYTWSKVSGSTATITSQYSPKTTITGLVAGSYQFKLIVKDSNGNTASATVNVTVNAAATSTTTLHANAGGNQTITLPTSSVTVDGAEKSTYPSGTTVLWRKSSGPAGGNITSTTSIKTTITGLSNAGEYKFQLRLTDSKGNLSTSSMYVYVNAGSTSSSTLKSVAGSNQTITLPTSSVTLDGTGSSGPSDLTHVWKQTSGPKTATIAYIYSIKTPVSGLTTAGTYSFQLELKDSKGNSAISTVYIIVNDIASSSSTLKSVAGSNQTITLPESGVELDGTNSSGPVGLTHLWKQTGGPKTATIASIYSIKTMVSGLTTAGDYSFQLEVKDPKGNVSTSTVHVIVKASTSGGSGEMRSDAGPDQTVKQPATSATIDGTGSTWTGDVTHVWTQEGGPVTANVKYPYSIKTDVTGLTKTGEYLFLLTLTDSKGNTSRNYTHVTVVSNVSARTSSSIESTEGKLAAGDDAMQMASPLLTSSTEQLTLRVNPNPVISAMNMQIDGKATGRASLKVYNMQGQVLMQQAFSKEAPSTINRSFNVSNLASGVYIAEVIVDNKYKQVTRIVKQ